MLTLIKLIADLTKKKMEQRQSQGAAAAPMAEVRRRRPQERRPVAAPIIAVPVVHSIQTVYGPSVQEFMRALGQVGSQEERRMAIGNFIFPFVQEIVGQQIGQSPMLAGKVTGMIIQLQEPDLSCSIATFESLQAKVREAVNLLQASGFAL